MHSRLLPLTITLAFTLAVTAPLAAQSTPESGARVSGSFAGSFGDGGSRRGFAVSAGYRFNRYFGFEFDAGYAGLMTFTANYVVEIPTGVRWFRPYFLGGGGLGNLSRRIAETGLVLDAGGGIDFPIVHGLAVGGDVRYFHLNAGGIDAARVGARVSYRF